MLIAAYQIATGEAFNPLKQDMKKGKLRFVRNCFPYKGYIWNYGCLPQVQSVDKFVQITYHLHELQTWEDPTSVHPDTKARGDNDPIDVCEIGEQIGYPGQVKQVKVLGVMALLDEGETDWKVLAIDVKDPMADRLNGKLHVNIRNTIIDGIQTIDIHDVEKYLPGLIDATRHWFKIYKMPDGKPANKFAFKGACKDRVSGEMHVYMSHNELCNSCSDGKVYATHVIHETHNAWKKLIQGKIPAKADTHDINV